MWSIYEIIIYIYIYFDLQCLSPLFVLFSLSRLTLLHLQNYHRIEWFLRSDRSNKQVNWKHDVIPMQLNLFCRFNVFYYFFFLIKDFQLSGHSATVLRTKDKKCFDYNFANKIPEFS